MSGSSLPKKAVCSEIFKKIFPLKIPDLSGKSISMLAVSCILTGCLLFSGARLAAVNDGGMPLYFLAFIIMTAAGLMVLYHFNLPLRFHVYAAIFLSAFGIIMDIFSLYHPDLSLVSSALLGAGATICLLIPYTIILIFKNYPFKISVRVNSGIVFLLLILLIGSGLEIVNDNQIFIYVISTISVLGNAVLCILKQPFFLRSFNHSYSQKTENNPFTGNTPVIPPEEPDALFSGEKLVSSAYTRLSARELEVAGLMLRGFSYTQIGEKLHIAPTTVITHRKSIYTKMGINSKRELFGLASQK